MNLQQARIIASGIRQLRHRIAEQRSLFEDVEIKEAYAAAYLDTLEEVVERFMNRHANQPISPQPALSEAQGVKPLPVPETGRGVYFSGNKQKDN